MSPEERQSAPRVPIMLSTCETELEEVSGHERDECRTRRQVLILSPLQDQRGRIGKRLWTSGGSHKGHKDAKKKQKGNRVQGKGPSTRHRKKLCFPGHRRCSPHRVQEGAVSPLSHQALSANQYLNKSSCASISFVKEHWKI